MWLSQRTFIVEQFNRYRILFFCHVFSCFIVFILLDYEAYYYAHSPAAHRFFNKRLMYILNNIITFSNLSTL